MEAQDKDPLLGYSCIYEIDRQEMKTLVGGIDLKIPGQNPSFDTERLLKKLGLIGPMYV